MAGGAFSRQLKQFLLGAPLGRCCHWWRLLGPQCFRPAPPNFRRPASLMALVPAVTRKPCQRIRPSKSRPPRKAIEGPAAPSRAPSAPGLQMVQQPLVEAAPGQVRLPWKIRRGGCSAGSRPGPSLTATGPWDAAPAVTETFCFPGSPPRHRYGHFGRPCPAGANGPGPSPPLLGSPCCCQTGQAYEGLIACFRHGRDWPDSGMNPSFPSGALFDVGGGSGEMA